MRVMVIVNGNEQANEKMAASDKERMFAAMGKYNEELVKAGVMLAGEGLLPTAQGKRVVFTGGAKSIVDGPFTEAKEVIGGYWLWQVKNMEEALEWARRCPSDPSWGEGNLELRAVAEMEDFGSEMTPELRAQEERLRSEIAQQVVHHPDQQDSTMSQKNKICIWYDKDAEEAARFYAKIFPNSKVGAVQRAPSDNPSSKEGDVLTVEFTVCGIPCVGLNGGPHFTLSEAFSFMITTGDQAETDRLWDAIVENGGQESQCGWCKDKWGVSWQITPRVLLDAMAAGGKEAKRAFEAMMSMKKIDVAKIEAARQG